MSDGVIAFTTVIVPSAIEYVGLLPNAVLKSVLAPSATVITPCAGTISLSGNRTMKSPLCNVAVPAGNLK